MHVGVYGCHMYMTRTHAHTHIHARLKSQPHQRRGQDRGRHGEGAGAGRGEGLRRFPTHKPVSFPRLLRHPHTPTHPHTHTHARARAHTHPHTHTPPLLIYFPLSVPSLRRDLPSHPQSLSLSLRLSTHADCGLPQRGRGGGRRSCSSVNDDNGSNSSNSRRDRW